MKEVIPLFCKKDLEKGAHSELWGRVSFRDFWMSGGSLGCEGVEQLCIRGTFVTGAKSVGAHCFRLALGRKLRGL